MNELFLKYAEFLSQENEKYNLTSIEELPEIQEKHFLDSLSLLEVIELPKSSKVLDVGSGAGFPGVPMKIARPDLRLTLLDSTEKKIEFLDQLLQTLELKADLVWGRAEKVAHQESFRERFDVVTARAVAGLPVLVELCLPFVKMGGVFLAYKGARKRTEQEREEAAPLIELLGGGAAEIIPVNSEVGERNILKITKVRGTPEGYPRKFSKISKKNNF